MMTAYEFSADDHRFMAEALRLAERGRLTADPNPAVGCVIVQDGEIVGRGFHRAAGEAHAEVHALREAGVRARGATAYVTLEPCSHHGRTPPCAEALIEAGIGEVIAAMVDPFPANAGNGLDRLARAGIKVRSGLMEPAARALNAGFVSRFERGRPWVRVKLAISQDGRTTGPDGRSKWITGAAARQDVQRWRGRASAILTGIGTVLADDPHLNLRLPGIDRWPLRVVVDSRARLTERARMLQLNGRVLVATAGTVSPWQRDGVEWLALPAPDGQRVDLAALMGALSERAVNEVHVEAGPILAGALIEAGLVDELLVYQAPVLLGEGSPMLALPGMENFDDRHHLELLDARRIGADWRFRYRL
ncbi:bifunctional diaminohydroxyphosphoribosylaminopyrimidine deaminase/5-amino-6-(5-phosphoribosylamino)uracil reductase RibD [Wenzhouxiangella marina]|uniref:Riboflavin biosynthesis protein RibD n=1 Tax=Wenzhouxiangella marina TaxID=1579979 RepID=A0A0K0XY97_9GAMM|nr:bifunctional diaminohydroxyphosphoribosylaminopyrimidine deaminase/5-amino-6-(5-phosphoribosylamino)uracil reductase RibD [Wenzhouxiangella marina]AKS42601.1 Riboflavin biosynthesis protein RibD [Wenzhouxiangella marina]MBB6085617.1 diaminohydroxyphosphoribosylaminopyrimidine deaminase/5-amino-6-(5-phosphoribosylamino)uracil reductase [Wenzhouxiangella marina]